MKKNQKKRSSNHAHHQQHIVYEDDLAVAARAAAADVEKMHTMQSFSLMRQNDDNNKVDNSSGDDENINSISYLVPYGSSSEDETDDGGDKSISSDSSDDESDIDLTEALSKMVAGEDGDDTDYGRKERKKNANTSSSLGPKTANELDPYAMCYDGLVSHNTSALELSNILAKDLGFAGNVKCHLVQERTVVVESVMGYPPLGEGSLLVLYEKLNNEDQKKTLPLGNVFEVFGPVSRPLYTVRLQSSSNKTRNDKEMTANKTFDSEEIDLDESSEVDNEEKVEETSIDEWSHDGRLTGLLKQRQSIPVYFIQKESHVIDTKLVIRQSGKGCDASNIYDEEINPDELDFSDDEKERSYKSSMKKSKQKNPQVQGRSTDGGLCAAATAANSTWSRT